MPKRREVVSAFDASLGDVLLWSDKWGKVRRKWIPAMPKKDVVWLIQAARQPRMFLDGFFFPSHAKNLRRIFMHYPDEAPALWVKARTWQATERKTRVGIARAFRRLRPDDKAEAVAAVIGKAWGGNGWVDAVEEADRKERVSGKRARKYPE